MRNVLLPACLLLSLSCGPLTVDEGLKGSRCLALSEPQGSSGLTVQLPSRVSWLFKVDTCGGEPVPGLTGEHFEIYEDGKRVSAYESQQQVAPRSERFRLYSAVLLDLSGSMLRSGDFPALQAASARYLDKVFEQGAGEHFVTLLTFDGRSEPQVLVPYTNELATLKAGLDSLSVSECSASADCAAYSDRRTCAGWRCVDDSTNLNSAAVGAVTALDGQLASSGFSWRDGALVIFTDGTDQAARVSGGEALRRVEASKTHVFTVGLGGEVDEAALRAFGKDGYWPVAKAEQLDAAFADIASRVAGLANRFYVLEYCSPRRGGTHSLEVRATWETQEAGRMTGSLSSQFDATGFESGCEL